VFWLGLWSGKVPVWVLAPVSAAAGFLLL